ncbi:MAG: hypothetical protein JEY96_20000 [Bacteroidales bacterium]|nr:hypothetical protein [Bacteroidales bacterium]
MINKRSEINHFEAVMGYHSKNNYRDGWLFKHKNMISEIQLHTYVNVLRDNGISIENVLDWFFKEYLKEEFGIEDFYLNFPSESTTYIEKCKIIAPEIESALRQYNLLVEDGCIDRDLLRMSSTPMSFSNCKSYLKNKYAYPDSNEFNRICYYFFSDQCMLSYIEKLKNKYKCFFDLIAKEKIQYDDYLDYQKRDLDWLLSNDYLSISNENDLMIKDLLKIRIMKDIYQNEEICFANVSVKIQDKIEELVESGILSTGEGLFSRNEVHYFNYNLNKSEFGNALDLRNMYVHGCFQNDVENSEIHKYNYYIFIKLIILIIIKINDELCNIKPALDSAVRAG